MAKIPKSVKNAALIPSLLEYLFSQGKVRDTYKLPFGDNFLLLLLATDRLSIFDFVLNALVPCKGEVLTALTHFWLTKIFPEFPNHLMNSNSFPDRNYALDFKETYSDIPLERCLAVMSVKIPEYEMIYRHHIGGSVYKKYVETGMAGGQKLEAGLPKWSALPKPLFTPSTKADEGHDINIDAQSYLATMGDKGKAAVEMFEAVYMAAYNYAKKKGILILDTKLEGLEVVADEVITPDSSRFTTIDDWEKAMAEGRDPIFYDKELVRQWGKTVETPFGTKGIHTLNPENSEHVKFVHSLEVPTDIINETTNRYLDIFKRLTDTSLLEYQESDMLKVA